MPTGRRGKRLKLLAISGVIECDGYLGAAMPQTRTSLEPATYRKRRLYSRLRATWAGGVDRYDAVQRVIAARLLY